ncbi:MAG: hypothetical protein H0Z39_08165 [Peptococcaceae bacterium]|nr:hypothetical protein [Peptococcaceae bacterium]
MGGYISIMKNKPLFSSEQIINISDLQRKWRSVVEPKLNKLPFLMMFSGSELKATILSYDKFEELWEKVNEAAELQLKMELLYRIFEKEKSGKAPVSLADVVLKTDITAEELEAAPDVELETD